MRLASVNVDGQLRLHVRGEQGYVDVGRATGDESLAELQTVLAEADIAFPIGRLWQLAPTSFSQTAGGIFFVPLVVSPGIEGPFCFCLCESLQ